MSVVPEKVTCERARKILLRADELYNLERARRYPKAPEGSLPEEAAVAMRFYGFTIALVEEFGDG